jgi:hypothetical protein
MSTGAWIATGLVAAAIIAPTVVYAAATSTVAIGTPTNTNTVGITATHQLLTAMVSPSSVVRTGIATSALSCTRTYLPPAGKAIVVTEVTYRVGTGTEGNDSWAELADEGCNNTYDIAETVRAYDSQTRTFPTGLPMASISIRSGPGTAIVFITGYLIPASSLPAVANVRAAGINRALTHTN